MCRSVLLSLPEVSHAIILNKSSHQTLTSRLKCRRDDRRFQGQNLQMKLRFSQAVEDLEGICKGELQKREPKRTKMWAWGVCCERAVVPGVQRGMGQAVRRPAPGGQAARRAIFGDNSQTRLAQTSLTRCPHAGSLQSLKFPWDRCTHCCEGTVAYQSHHVDDLGCLIPRHARDRRSHHTARCRHAATRASLGQVELAAKSSCNKLLSKRESVHLHTALV